MARRRPRRSATGPSGFVLVDKPRGPTSRDAVVQVARALDLPSSGHCGTLDPLASGLLVLVAGCATRVQDLFTGHDKYYLGTIEFGATSGSDDGEGPVVPREPMPDPLPRDAIESALAGFRGPIRQRPPALSAIRVDGERLFKKARRGEEVELPERSVVIHELILTDYAWPRVELSIHCGSGTYIRSLARDLGEVLGTGGWLASLRRTRCGTFDLSRAREPVALTVADVLTLEEALAGVPRVDVPPPELESFLGGRELAGAVEVPEDAIAWCDGRVVARARPLGGGRYRMRRLIRDPREAE